MRVDASAARAARGRQLPGAGAGPVRATWRTAHAAHLARPRTTPYQGGHDSFHAARGGADADAFFERALALEVELGVPIYHETHRGRLLFSPWNAVESVIRHPRLRLLGDLSHYCAVAEASCGDEVLEAAVARLIPHIRHLHLRVGFAEGPQVRSSRMRLFHQDSQCINTTSQTPLSRCLTRGYQPSPHSLKATLGGGLPYLMLQLLAEM